MARRIFVLLGNPDKESFSGRIAAAYAESARKAGHDVKRLNISDLRFDPVLRKGYKEIQPLEPDLKKVQEHWNWADHVVIVYPNWWCTMPASLKGMFDRMFLPGFAFNFDTKTHKVIQRMKGKTARVIILAGTHSPFMTWLKFGDFTNEIRYAILEFSGMKADVSTYGPSDHVSEKTRTKWVREIERLGAKAR